MPAKFEYLGEDKEVQDARLWEVEAIHVTTTGNKRKFTLPELVEGARSLGFRPLNINHDNSRRLEYWNDTFDFLTNNTMPMRFDPEKMAVVGSIRVSDMETNRKIESGDIEAVSIEQIPTKGESCNEILCEQHGVTFIGLALLERGVLPGDPRAKIIKKETLRENFDEIKNVMVSNEQRECRDCSDFEACHTCKHKIESNDNCMQKAIEKIRKESQDLDRDSLIALSITECGLAESKEEAWAYYKRWIPYTEAILENKKQN